MVDLAIDQMQHRQCPSLQVPGFRRPALIMQHHAESAHRFGGQWVFRPAGLIENLQCIVKLRCSGGERIERPVGITQSDQRTNDLGRVPQLAQNGQTTLVVLHRSVGFAGAID
jgi:hypothetical protein